MSRSRNKVGRVHQKKNRHAQRYTNTVRRREEREMLVDPLLLPTKHYHTMNPWNIMDWEVNSYTHKPNRAYWGYLSELLEKSKRK